MINDYSELKHRCLIFPFDEFCEVMGSLYDLEWEDEADESWLFLWDFKNSHFKFKTLGRKAKETLQIEDITFKDIAEFFRLTNIIDIICTEGSSGVPEQVYIIYD